MSYNIPDTSRAAYQIAQRDLIQKQKAKVLASLRELGTANYETIAAHANIDKHAVGRRAIELIRDKKIYKPGTKSATSTGCMAYDYAIMEPKTPTENEYKPGTVTAADHAIKLIESARQGNLFQNIKT